MENTRRESKYIITYVDNTKGSEETAPGKGKVQTVQLQRPEKSNDGVRYRRIADQSDFDKSDNNLLERC